MGRHTGSVCKLCRREGAKLFLKGEKCYSAKCPFAKRSYAPGQHGQGKIRESEFGLRLREKQKARRIYGLGERQFRNYFELASKSKSSTGEKLLELLERRLDNVVYRLGFAASRNHARQMVRNGNITVKSKKVNVPSFTVKVGDLIGVKEKIRPLVLKTVESLKDKQVPSWLTADMSKVEGAVQALPNREEIGDIIDERLIVEFYSR